MDGRPRASGDPYAVSSRCGTGCSKLKCRWLWFPAFAGTTWRLLRRNLFEHVLPAARERARLVDQLERAKLPRGRLREACINEPLARRGLLDDVFALIEILQAFEAADVELAVRAARLPGD